MRKNEKCVLTCAPKYAYGAAGSPPNIPPESVLKFELELLSWKGQLLGDDGGIERFVIKRSEKKKTPNDGAHVKAHITGTFEGRTFDDRDVEFNIGEGEDCNVISGIEIALEKMSILETSRLIIKPKYAFGADGNEQFKIPKDAVVEYLVTLTEFEKEVEAWKLDATESLTKAKELKEKGTNYFKDGKFKMALKFYGKCLNFLSNCGKYFCGHLNSLTHSFKILKHVDAKVEGEARTTQIAIHLNKALCQQKLNDLDEVKHSCNEVLSLDPNNVKALFRRGQAYFTLGEIENALADFEDCRRVEPANKAAQNQMTICKQKLKEYHEQEKRRYKNMFAKFSTADRQTADNLKNAEDFANFGEWKEEERSHTITKFEEENPNL